MKVAIHMLTPYPPSNPNRDELGMPKTATVGGELRQRISSQALKRAWRLSEPLSQIEASLSVRTRAIGEKAQEKALEAGADGNLAKKIAKAILIQFGKEHKNRPLNTAEVVILGHEEWAAAMELAETCALEAREPSSDELDGLQRSTTSVDVALFGRMRAAAPKFNVDAAVSVSHALTANKIRIEADFWTAVDDLNERAEDAGSGGMGEREFGSGVYYVYAVVDMERLVENLEGNSELAAKTVNALIKAMATTTPGGHRTSFGHQTYAAYLGIEHSSTVSGNLMLPAFESPVQGTAEAISHLKDAMSRVSGAYGLDGISREMSVPEGIGSLTDCLV